MRGALDGEVRELRVSFVWSDHIIHAHFFEHLELYKKMRKGAPTARQQRRRSCLDDIVSHLRRHVHGPLEALLGGRLVAIQQVLESLLFILLALPRFIK